MRPFVDDLASATKLMAKAAHMRLPLASAARR
jgi:hypothetical protein